MTTIAPSTVRFARRPTRGVMLGFSALRCGVIGLAFVVMLLGLLLAGGWGLVVTGPLWAMFLASAFVTAQGRATRRMAARGVALVAARLGETDGVPDAGHGASTGGHDGAAWRRSAASLLRRPRHRDVLHSRSAPPDAVGGPRGVALRLCASRSERANPARLGLGTGAGVAGPDRNLRGDPGLGSTIPDPGAKVAQWYEEHATKADDWANGEYQQLLAQSSFGSSTHRTTITLTLDMKKASAAIRAAGRGMKGAVHVLRIDMTVLEQGLRAAGLRLGGWLNEAQSGGVIRQAYDPSSELDARRASAKLRIGGPIAVSEHWSYLRHDSGYSAVLWISEWPRIDVAPHFLHALIFAPDIRKSLSLIARPLGTAEALRALRKEKTEAITDSRHKAKVGQVQDLSDVQEYQDLLAREQALIGGHADVEFSGFLTVTAASEEGLTQAVALIERSAGQSGCETRILYGRQSQGFVVECVTARAQCLLARKGRQAWYVVGT